MKYLKTVLLMVFMLISIKPNSETTRTVNTITLSDTTRKKDSTSKKDTVKKILVKKSKIRERVTKVEYYDFKEYKEMVSGHEASSKYWIWQYGGGPACGKYQMEYLARRISGYGHVTKNKFYQLGYSDYHGTDSANKKVFDVLWSEQEQEQAMDSLCNYMIHWLEVKSGGTVEQLLVEINSKGYPVEVTDAMVLGGMHFMGVETFLYSARYGSFYSVGNSIGYTLWKCMLRYKGIKIKKTRIKWNIQKIKKVNLRISPLEIFPLRLKEKKPIITSAKLNLIQRDF